MGFCPRHPRLIYPQVPPRLYIDEAKRNCRNLELRLLIQQDNDVIIARVCTSTVLHRRRTIEAATTSIERNYSGSVLSNGDMLSETCLFKVFSVFC